MKNFCFFTFDQEGSDNETNKYDDSLIEWRRFQNSRIIEPEINNTLRKAT